MKSDDLTIEILRSIRDGVHETNARLDRTREELSQRIDQTREELGQRIDQTNARLDRLERRQVESEVRLSTEIAAVAGAVYDVRDLLRDNLSLGRRVDDHETRLRRLESSRQGAE